MTTETELKPFVVSDSETLTDDERKFMETGTVPEGFKQPDGIEPVTTRVPAEEKKPDAEVKPAAEAKPEVIEGEDGEEVVIVGKDGKPRAQNGRFVPHQALHAEREEHKKTRGELQQLREKFAAGDAKLQTLYQLAGVDLTTGQPAAAKTKSPLEEDTIPFAEKPIEAWNQQQRRLEYLASQLVERDKKIGEVAGRVDSQAQNAQLKTWVENDIRQFASKNPAFGMAWTHVMDTIKKELLLTGIDEAQVEAELNERSHAFITEARNKGKSAAALIWALAEARGFKAPEIEMKDGKPVLKGAAQTGPAPGTQEAAAQVDAIKRGQAASASLSAAGGSSGDTLTLAKLADMSEEEYAAVRRKLGKNGMRQYLGA